MCPCGCGGTVKPGGKVATRACWHRVLTPDQRRAWSLGHGRKPKVRPHQPCPQCGRPFAVRRSRRRYCSQICGIRHRATAPEFAEWRAKRLMTSIAANRQRHLEAALARAAKAPSKVAAYQAGYSAGYERAYRWWKHRVELLERRRA